MGSDQILCLHLPVTISTNNQYLTNELMERRHVGWGESFIYRAEQHLLSSSPFSRRQHFHQGDSSHMRLPLLSYLMLFRVEASARLWQALVPRPMMDGHGGAAVVIHSKAAFLKQTSCFSGATNRQRIWRYVL